ncbi:hypothetical protein LTR53_008118 [Teratosphaeriaceae sp. CCFEE 6253]|nr:hypothetical protein LTR53_008118 [Teratosphaeriaceae sp. CCFEE 6253]
MASLPEVPADGATPKEPKKEYYTAARDPADVRLQDNRHVYGQNLLGLGASAARFVPTGPYDVTLASLRMVVFQVDHTSATPIAQVIREERNDIQICDLIAQCRISPPTKVADGNAPNGIGERRVVLDAGPLGKVMKEARIKHAENLRDTGFVDVDIVYKCDGYRVEPYKSDKDLLAALGGKAYHMHPYRKVQQEMAYSVIVQPWALDKVYTPDHREYYEITIKTNTAVAPDTWPGAAPEMTRPNTMFPYEPALSQHISGDEKCEKFVKTLRGRSDSTQKVIDSPKKGSTTWHTYSSGIRAGKPPPDAPFSGDPGILGNDQWWMDDLAKRTELIVAWHLATWKPVGTVGNYGRVATEADPRTAVAGLDYLVVPAMCNTYTDNRNYQWYTDNVVRADEAQLIADLKQAQEAYDECVGKADNFYCIFTNLQLSDLALLEPERWHEQMQGARRFEIYMRREAKSQGEWLQKVADKCAVDLDPTIFEQVDRFREKARRTVREVQQQQQQQQQQVVSSEPLPAPAFTTEVAPTVKLPDTPIPRHMPEVAQIGRGRDLIGRVGATMKAAHLPPITATTTAFRTEVAATDSDTIPFPAYEDPMVADMEDVVGTQQDTLGRVKRSQGSGKTSEALTCVRDDQQPRVDSAQTALSMLHGPKQKSATSKQLGKRPERSLRHTASWETEDGDAVATNDSQRANVDGSVSSVSKAVPIRGRRQMFR